MLKKAMKPFNNLTRSIKNLCKRPKGKQSTQISKNQQKILYLFINELFVHNVPLASLDMGGSLIKLVIFIPNNVELNQFINDKFVKYYIPEQNLTLTSLNGTFMFYKFTYDHIEDLFDLFNSTGFPFKDNIPLRGSGGGIHKYKDLIIQRTKFKHIDFQDELSSVVVGLLFMNYMKIDGEMYMNTKGDNNAPSYTETGLDLYESHLKNLKHILLDNLFTKEFQRNYKAHGNKRVVSYENLYPLLYVQIGTGIGILKIDGLKFERVDGSAFGGQSFIVLSQLLNKAQNGENLLMYQDVIKKIHNGCPNNLTMTVGDIYGKDYKDLPSDIPAAFCGRYNQQATLEDEISALHELFCINIAQIACLNARIYGLQRIIFGGSFVTLLSEECIKIGVAYYSKNQIDCIFTHHDGFLGSIGTLLGAEQTCQQEIQQYNQEMLQKVAAINDATSPTLG